MTPTSPLPATVKTAVAAQLQLPDASRTAWLLDFDGTLVDFAPAPDQVVLAAGLAETLGQLRARSNGALGIISGRPIAQIDALLPGIPHAVAGEHGTAIRHAPDEAIERKTLPAAPEAWLEAASAVVAAHPGTRLERKSRGFVLHYRTAPEAGTALHAVLDGLVGGNSTEFELMPASMAWEVRPRGADKGDAVRALMQRPPFAGRLPLYIGDDVTDQDGIDAACRLGGAGLLVGERFGDPAGVRRWLTRCAESRGQQWPGW
jgi:trehalose 6-phosphate phosphatase